MKHNKNNYIKTIFLWFFIAAAFVACDKDYITGGKPQDVNQYKDLSTYDFLKTNIAFDTLVQLIDAGNLQDAINQTGTFFAVTNKAVFGYLDARTQLLQNTVNINAKFTLDSLKYYITNNINGTKDSLLMYLIPGKILTPDILTQNGALYASGLKNNTVAVSYEQTKDDGSGYTNLISSVPQLVYFTQLWQPYTIDDDNPIADVPSGVGVHASVSTSFIYTKSGVVNVLAPSSSAAITPSKTLFFYGSR